MRAFAPGFAISLITLLVLSLIFEGCLRFQRSRDHDKLVARYGDRDLCTRRAGDARLVYEFVPDQCGMNSHGFDDVERQLDKPAGRFRIVLIGDSVAQGQGVARGERFGNLIGAQLNNSFGADRFEVVNLARTGYSTAQELVVLEEIGLDYQPDLILWSYVLNDPAHPVFHDANGELGRYYSAPTWLTRHFVERKAFELRERLHAFSCGREFHTLLHCAYRDEVAARIGRLAEISRARGVPVVFLIHPILEEDRTFSTYSLSGIHRDLADIASTEGLVPMDLLSGMEGVTPPELAQSPEPRFDPWHPNALGHALVARYVTNELERLGLLGGGSRDGG